MTRTHTYTDEYMGGPSEACIRKKVGRLLTKKGTEFAELAGIAEVTSLNLDARNPVGTSFPLPPHMTEAHVAHYCIAVHVGAGYHSERHASEYRRLIAAACYAAVDVLKEVRHLFDAKIFHTSLFTRL